jgi:Ni/Fe-hydrogenase subunit HybB-like protein
MSGHVEARPVGGKMLDPLMKTLLALFGVSVGVMAYRFATGVGPVSNMTDGYAWGIWEPVNVVVFTGIGAGAYAVGLLCYLFNQGKYHPFVRPAVLLGAIAYSLGGSSILIALGRYWNAYLLPLPQLWNLGSALLEVALCVMTYVAVLWVEVLPSILEAAKKSDSPAWARFGARWGGQLAKAMPYIIALAMVLPTMHQSSLGGLMLIAGPKIHPLWHTALLPFLFLVSCLSMGYAAVVVLTTLLNVTWGAQHDQALLARMSKVNAALLFVYAFVRVADLAVKGNLRYLAVADFHLFFFVLELALFVVPAFLFLSPEVQRNKGRLFGAALLALAGGALYRVDTYLTAYNGGEGFQYMPSVGETVITIGMAAIGMAVFIFVARLFPVVVIDDARKNPNAGAGSVRAAASR